MEEMRDIYHFDEIPISHEEEIHDTDDCFYTELETVSTSEINASPPYPDYNVDLKIAALSSSDSEDEIAKVVADLKSQMSEDNSEKTVDNFPIEFIWNQKTGARYKKPRVKVNNHEYTVTRVCKNGNLNIRCANVFRKVDSKYNKVRDASEIIHIPEEYIIWAGIANGKKKRNIYCINHETINELTEGDVESLDDHTCVDTKTANFLLIKIRRVYYSTATLIYCLKNSTATFFRLKNSTATLESNLKNSTATLKFRLKNSTATPKVAVEFLSYFWSGCRILKSKVAVTLVRTRPKWTKPSPSYSCHQNIRLVVSNIRHQHRCYQLSHQEILKNALLIP